METRSPRVFVSYGRHDGAEFVDRLVAELTGRGFDVWRDTTRIDPGSDWQAAIVDAIDACDVVVAALTPHAVRRPTTEGGIDGVCLDELTYARFGPAPKPVVPVLVLDCQVPFSIFRLSYIDARSWRQSLHDFATGIGEVVRGIDATLRGDLPVLRQPDGPVALDQGPYLHAKRAGFVGREWLFKRVAAWVSQARNEQALLITGDPGVGKSAFIAEFAHRNADGRVVAYHCCTREDRLTLEPGAFVENVAAMLSKRLPSYAPMLAEGTVRKVLREAHAYPGRALDKAIIGPLSRLPEPDSGPFVMLVDALDEAMLVGSGDMATDDTNIVSLLASRLDRLPLWLRVVATARRDRRITDELAGLRATVIDAQAEENVDDLTAFVDSRVRATLEAADPAQVTREVVQAADGNFLYAKSLIQDVQRGLVPIDGLTTQPAGMSGFYAKAFRRLLSSPTDSRGLRAVLETMVAAQAPLDYSLVTGAAGNDEYETTAVLNQLSEFVHRRSGGFVLFHRSLSDWLVDPRSSFHADPQRGHERLAADFVAAHDIGLQPPSRPALKDSVLAYRGRYGLDHLTRSYIAVAATWNPWVFASTTLAADEAGHAFGGETRYLPVFARQYVAHALTTRNTAALASLVQLLARAARTRYHDSGVLNIEIAADGTWKTTILGDAHDGMATYQALTLSSWAGSILYAAVESQPDSGPALAAAGVAANLGGLAYVARGLDIAGWADRFQGSLTDRGDFLASELHALTRINEAWTPDEDNRLRALVGESLTRAYLRLDRARPTIRTRANELGLPPFTEDG